MPDLRDLLRPTLVCVGLFLPQLIQAIDGAAEIEWAVSYNFV